MIDNYDLYRCKESGDYAWLIKRPECCMCGEHIQEEEALYLDGEWICEQCIKDNMREVEND